MIANEAPDAARADADPVKLLVVDDVPQNLLAMQALLQQPGVQLLTASSGAQALELLLQHEDVALALLDVQMPEMDGFTLAELMRGSSRTRDIPIIFVTASPRDPARLFRGYESGAVDFLHKPLEPHVLLGKVRVFVELHRQRRLLRQRNEELERLLKLNEVMMAVLSHDLRTPLSAIMMSAEVLRHLAANDAALRAALRVKSSGQRMSHMISQLLDFSRIRSGSLALDAQPHDLRSVADAAVAELRQAHAQARIEVLIHGDLRGRFDADRMAQVLSNLVGNALHHGEAGQPVRVVLDGSEAATLRVLVRNAGRLPDEALPRLFEPFKGAHEGRPEGLGLGLYIVQQFVHAHGGRVSGRNTVEGVEFEVVLPRHADQAPSATTSPQPEPVTTNVPNPLSSALDGPPS
ncbi:hybrid sensor histidine kinase/response regulator [Azohydromonas caseinilytica]|uniref:histidine kinase n=1 Tax=Azohydromonas caseinilytica TaxID=2728836 RepID=A0A848FGW8_9BURK|nr:hybrid sensor histidine kinase/response regulator [Azohydromonas caseinilytica]NML18708.1 hybrid sensor histidine kinase/response regulator [Azohydromonas caseinilytica]